MEIEYKGYYIRISTNPGRSGQYTGHFHINQNSHSNQVYREPLSGNYLVMESPSRLIVSLIQSAKYYIDGTLRVW